MSFLIDKIQIKAQHNIIKLMNNIFEDINKQ